MRHPPPTPDQLRRGELATWGEPPRSGPQTQAQPRMRLISWKPLRKNSLLGFAAVELPIGLKVHDIPLLASHGKVWASAGWQIRHPGRSFLTPSRLGNRPDGDEL
jgi:hypothetical protein